MNEQLEALTQENAELQSRTAEAEAIIEDLKRLIALKDDELAAMQQQLSGVTAGEQVALVDEGAEEFVDDSEQLTEPEQVYAGEQESEFGDTEDEVVEQDEAVGQEEESISADDTEEESSVEEDAAAEETTTAVEQDYQAPAAPEGLVDQVIGFVTDNLIAVAGGLAGLLLVVVLAVFLSRRKGKGGDTDSDAVAEAAPTEFPDFSGAEEASAGDEVADSEAETAVHEESAAEESAEEEEADADDADETPIAPMPEEEPEEDPLAEVNVFLAYEHFEQAEEFVRDAIAGEPDNLDFHAKLLEVFYASGNKKGYEEEAAVLNGLVNGEGPHWDMALAMWSEMSPNRALFAEPVAGEEEQVADTGGGIVDLTADEDTAAADPGLDFDLGTGDSEQPAAVTPAAGADDDVLDITAGGDDESVLDVTAAASSEEDILDVTAAVGSDDLAGEDLLDVTAAVGLDNGPESGDEPAADSDTAEQEDVLDITGGASADDDMLDITGGAASADDDLLDVTGHTDLGGAELEEDLLDVTSATSAGADSDALLEVAEQAAAEEAAAVEDDNALDFDIGGVEPPEAAEDAESLEIEGGSGDNVIEFDAASGAETEAVTEDEGGLDFDIGGLEAEPSSEPVLDIEAGSDGDQLNIDETPDDSLEIDLSLGDGEDEGLELDIDVPEAGGDEADEGLELNIDVPEATVGSDEADEGLEIDLSDSDDDFSLDIGLDEDTGDDGDTGAEIDLTIDAEDSGADSLEIGLDEALASPEIEDDLAIDLEIDSDDAEQDNTPSIEVDMDGTVEMPKIDFGDDDAAVVEVDDDFDDDDDDDDDDHTVFVPRSSDANEQSAADEIATKLDLAKAYVELGDKDSAKSILDEVIADGNDEQRQQAQDLLSQV